MTFFSSAAATFGWKGAPAWHAGKKVRACGEHHHVLFLFLSFLLKSITSCQTWSNLTIASYNQRPFGKFLATNYCMAIVVGLHWQLQSRQVKSWMLNKGIAKMLYIYLRCRHSEHQKNPFQSIHTFNKETNQFYLIR